MPVSDSIAALTAPHEATVVMAANSAVEAMPKRCSLPSMLTPCDAGGVHRRRRVDLGDVDDHDADDEQRPSSRA